VATVLEKHQVQYYVCSHCGFVQTEEPYWLEEAYSEAITRADIGLVGRNVLGSEQVKLLILAFFNDRGKFLDYGGGYGMFVRLMRDAGLNFYLYDQYCENLFAKGFEVDGPGDGSFELVTAFEVFEHLVDPIKEIDRMREFSPSILFSTNLVTSPPPPLGQWWYYVVEHGQHVSLYTKRSLQVLAERFGMNLCSDGLTLHLLTPRGISQRAFRAMFNRYVRIVARKWLMRRLRGRSLLSGDYEMITRHKLD
jgi:hypothetical protein